MNIIFNKNAKNSLTENKVHNVKINFKFTVVTGKVFEIICQEFSIYILVITYIPAESLCFAIGLKLEV